MKPRSAFALALLIVALAAWWLGIRLLLRWQTARAQIAGAQIALHTAVLRQAPCLEAICPGFDQGREAVLDHLSQSTFVSAALQGTRAIRLLFTDEQGELIGSGIMYFISNPASQVVDRVYIRLYDLDLGSVIHTLGEPDEFLFVSGCGEAGGYVHAKLLYPSRGIEVTVDYDTRAPASQVLTAGTGVAAIWYFMPTEFSQHLSASLDLYVTQSVAFALPRSVTQADFVAQIEPWPGLAAAPTPSADFCPR